MSRAASIVFCALFAACGADALPPPDAAAEAQSDAAAPKDAAPVPDAQEAFDEDAASPDAETAAADAGVSADASVEPDAALAPDAAPPPSTITRLGPAPTPISLSVELDTPTHHLFVLYESTASMVLVSVEKATGRRRERPVLGHKIAYALEPDALDPNVVWIAASLPAALLRYDVVNHTLETAATFPPDSHTFDVDQGPDGTLYVGTYPQGRLIRVLRDPPRVASVIFEPRSLAGTRPYLHGVFAGGQSLYLHYASPGILLRHDLSTGQSEALLDSTQNFLYFLKSSAGLTVSGDGDTRSFDADGIELSGSVPHPIPPRATVLRDRLEIVLPTGTASVSLAPRSTGMAITFFGRTRGRSEIIGGTYWNHWLFSVEEPTRLQGWGALRGGSGEFFATGLLDGLIAIPNYQGDMYLFDPSYALPNDELDTPAATHLFHVPGAHFGLATTDDGAGTLYYSTAPNYERAGGMLIQVGATRTPLVRDRLDGDTTIGALAFTGGALVGATKTARGLGLGPPVPSLLRVMRFDPGTLATIATSTCGAAGDQMRALIPVNGALVGVTALGELMTIDPLTLACAPLDHLPERIYAAAEHDGLIVLLTPTQLIAWDAVTNFRSLLARAPNDAMFLAPSADGSSIYIASTTTVYRYQP